MNDVSRKNGSRLAVAILEVMWDWRSMTSDAGYVERAPGYFRINQDNLTGGRIYDWLGPRGEYYDDLLVTNACPELVSSARGRGTPDPKWLRENLRELWPFSLLLICGRVAQNTFQLNMIPDGLYSQSKGRCRIVEVPHPAARVWSRKSLNLAGQFIRDGKTSISLSFRDGRLVGSSFIPF